MNRTRELFYERASADCQLLDTLPREYMGSIVTFLAVLGLSRVKARVRIGILSFLCVYCFYHVRLS